MQCSLCGTPGTSFTKAAHPRHGVVYLCDACRDRERRHLGRADPLCSCDPDSALHH
jgi:hypothetical protein